MRQMRLPFTWDEMYSPAGSERSIKIGRAEYVRTAPNYEIDLYFYKDWYAWYGFLLMGFYDAKIFDRKNYCRGITFVWHAHRPCIGIKAGGALGGRVAWIHGSTQLDCLQSLKHQLRTGVLEWKKDKYFKG